MKKILFFVFVLLLLLLLLFGIFFDFQISFLISKLRTDLLNKIMLWITNFSSVLVIFFLVTIIFLWKKRKWILPLWFSLAFSAVISFLMKIVVARERPFQLGISTLPNLILPRYLAWDNSMPSFHVAAAFSALPIIEEKFPKIKFFWICFAILIAISRIYFALHFLTDIIIGAAIGYGSGKIFIKIFEKEK